MNIRDVTPGVSDRRDALRRSLLKIAAKVLGVAILDFLLLRIGAKDFLASHPDVLHVPVIAIGDALLVLAVATLTAQRLEIWQRASRMLAEARGAIGPPPPSSLVS